MTNDGQNVYEWDDADRLRSVRSVESGQTLMTCRYDGLGRRRERIVSSVAGVGDPGTNRYIYHDPAEGGAGWLVLEVRDGGNNVLEAYTHGPDLSGTLGGAGGIGGILTCTSGTTNRWFHYDGNGNVIACTDTNRSVVSRLEYGPFGTVLVKTGPYTPRYQFSSKEFDAAAGLNYYGFRYYSQNLGRFLSLDPIGIRGGINLYNFVKNNPAIRTDFLGLCVGPGASNGGRGGGGGSGSDGGGENGRSCPCTDEQKDAALKAKEACKEQAHDTYEICIKAGDDYYDNIEFGGTLISGGIGVLIGCAGGGIAGGFIGGVIIDNFIDNYIDDYHQNWNKHCKDNYDNDIERCNKIDCHDF